MLRLIRRISGVTLTLALVACTPAPEVAAPFEMEKPVQVEAVYRLMFNDALVGNAFFSMQIMADGSYVIEALTIPAGKMQQAEGHEVLESSRGNYDSTQIRPAEFTHSVINSEHIEVINLMFDWESHALRLVNGDEKQTVSLQPGTHDRLSYLLAARRLAATGTGAVQVQIASPQASEQTRLEVRGIETVEVPAGSYRAVGIARATPEEGETRMLWFDVQSFPLPLRVSHSWDGKTVEMVLETLSQTPGDPR
ncbi:MAG: DUF3108 domain-containing protein [Sedimenticolaceae bacterium]|nr:DUF3108 domain-containing protein [Gammaproteobacteria bacterium]